MEKHIFKFGNSSLAMVLPKKWVDKNSLDGSSAVFMSENSKGELVISSKSMQRSTVTKPIDRHTSPEFSARIVRFYYMWGAGKLVLTSKDGFSQLQLKEMHRAMTNDCPGFEVIGQTKTEIEIEDLTNMKDIDINRIMGRLRSLLNQQLQAVLEGNVDTVGRIEELVDRFYLLGVRYVNMVQPTDAIQYYRTMLLMENMSDDLVRMAPSYKTTRRLIEFLTRAFTISEEGFKGDQKAIAEASNIREEAISAIDSAKIDSLHKKIFKECIFRCSHISEFGLLKEDPTKSVIY